MLIAIASAFAQMLALDNENVKHLQVRKYVRRTVL